MGMELVTLGQSDTDKHGRRYTDAEKKAAYLTWRIVAGRSARKVAERLDIEERTIRRWIEAESWAARANEEDHDDYGSMRIAAVALVTNEVAPSIEVVKEIRDDKTAMKKDRLAAAFWLAGLGGVSPVSKIEQAVIQAPKAAEVIDVPQLVGLSPDDLMKLEQATREKKK
jgi:hypothetical protein